MSITIEKPIEVGQKTARKHANKRSALVESATQSLARNGYSETNLRTIAADAGVSLGTIHYYFESKDELLKHCVVRVKEDFLELINKAILNSERNDNNIAGELADVLASTIANDRETHRLWYDLRTQAMYSETIHAEVNRLEVELAATLGMILKLNESQSRLVYLQADAIFRYWLVRSMTGDTSWRKGFHEDFQNVLNRAV